MGQFSWKTSDTNESISNIESNTVYMLDGKGGIWVEHEYEGYGEFGGKDFYELLAEMNGLESDRHIGINLWFAAEKENSRETLVCPRLVRNKENVNKFNSLPVPKDCENQGWVRADGSLFEEEEEEDW